jgi:hypothetical protein
MQLNAAGSMLSALWLSLPVSIPGLVLDCHIVMPDHFHAVLALNDPWLTHEGLTREHPRPDLSNVLGVFKSLGAREYGKGVREAGWRPYEGKFWQRGFWDHSLISDADVQRHREYVVTNPMRWQLRHQGHL